MVVPHWAIQGHRRRFRPAGRRSRARAVRCGARSSASWTSATAGASVRIARYAPQPEWAGLDLVAIAGRAGTTPLEVVLDIQRHGGAQAISFGMCEDDVREVMRHDFVATASDGVDPPARPGRPAPPAFVRHLPAQDPLRARRQGPLARAGDPLVLGLAGRDPRPARSGRASARAPSPTSSSSTRRRSATRRRSTSRRGTSPGVNYLFVNGVGVDRRRERLRSTPSPSGRLPGPGTAAAPRMVRPTRSSRSGGSGPATAAKPWAEALAARGGAIAAVGAWSDVRRFRGRLTRLIERPDAFAIPGLIDAHGHMESLGASQEEIDLRGVAVARRGRPAGQGADRRRRPATHGSRAGTGTRASGRAERSRPPRCSTRWPRAGRSGSGGSTVTPAGPTPRPCGGPRSRKDTQAPPDGQIIRDQDGNRRASSSTARWAWSAAPCPARPRLDVRRTAARRPGAGASSTA